MSFAQTLPQRTMLNKVPAITAFFWIIKVLATTVGETGADMLNVRLGFGPAGTSLVFVGLLFLVLRVQFRADRYLPWAYWVAVVLISVVGTLITDGLTDGLDVPLAWSTIGFALALAATFAIWYRSEGTLSIHTIVTTRREAFYWLAILFTFALGTAAGDLLAEQLALGYLASLGVFAGGIAVVAVLYYARVLNGIASFWIAYVLTRPLGASCGDLLSQPVEAGGLGLGTILTSVLFLGVILALVAYLARTGRDEAAVAPGVAP